MFEGDNGEKIREVPIPADMVESVKATRKAMVEALAEVDDTIGELYLLEEDPTEEQLKTAIRRATIDLKFVPVFMGSAYKTKGVQLLLNGVVDYLPAPHGMWGPITATRGGA